MKPLTLDTHGCLRTSLSACCSSSSFLLLIILLYRIHVQACTFAHSSISSIVIVKSIFLERPQKRSRGNQLIHRRLIKTESIGRGSKSRQSGRQTVRRLRWMMFRVEMAREVRGGEGIGIGFVKKQCFQF